ncbi:NAD-dependent protein lipoamidase sirtuin-4 [Geranomyces variabilis]|uniref:NAD-dependent protein lipoamidase sirtuin-4 n=1 Tax=Geranomyces variabilis TaxID=109894 RepID=A0AAD5XTZ1_9FUNG|nr:NAD-dependent protein lipoamidase sirtuin-4 [Geranomyces variabilis]
MAALLTHLPQTRSQSARLAEVFLRAEGQLAVLTGAGISTDSGVPDYRGPKGIYVKNKDYRPIRYQEFVSSHPTRQRYWSRSYLGFPRIARALPNRAHIALRALQPTQISGLITQNVDGLHPQWDKSPPIEMHGSLHRVHCLACKHAIARTDFQHTVGAMNPELVEWARRNPRASEGDVASSTRPDGDVEAEWDSSGFRYPDCEACGSGMLKPSVVFFGENIDLATRDKTFDLVDSARALLCIGTSLQVYSAFRLVARAKAKGAPVAVLSLGETRADSLVDLKIEDSCADVLEGVQELLGC